jgi:acetylornithine deacetylase/succinyl-diaminopimelate desuccinylase-like protein
VAAEIRELCGVLTARGSTRTPDVAVTFSQLPSDVSVEAPIVRALTAAIAANGGSARIEGMTAWTDAALLNAAGVPAICYGPGDITLAHAAEEYVPIDEIEQATAVLSRLAQTWSTGNDSAWRS